MTAGRRALIAVNDWLRCRRVGARRPEHNSVSATMSHEQQSADAYDATTTGKVLLSVLEKDCMQAGR